MQRPGFLGEETYIKKKESKRPPETPIPYLTLDKILLRFIRSFNLLSPLVFTVTALKVSLFLSTRKLCKESS